jgi:DnaJ-class molecular chaperone
MVSDHVKGLCGTIRQAKAHDKPCPKCDGAGANTGKPCKTCRGCGFLPKVSYEMAGGE